jgi:hypothetical protein
MLNLQFMVNAYQNYDVKIKQASMIFKNHKKTSKFL